MITAYDVLSSAAEILFGVIILLSMPFAITLHVHMKFIDQEHFNVNAIKARIKEQQEQMVLQQQMDKYLVAEVMKQGIMKRLS